MTLRIPKCTVLVFGASGYLGSNTVNTLLSNGYDVIALSRNSIEFEHPNLRCLHMNFLDFDINQMSEIDTVIYCAGIAHNRYKSESLKFVNVELPKILAKRCVDKVRNFIFISSVNVLGLGGERVFDIESNIEPKDDNAFLKLESENTLREVFKESVSNLVILRCPMIYGPNSPGNFKLLVKLSTFPLPFKNNETIRSNLYIDNFNDVILTLLSYDKKLPEVFMPADSNPLKLNQLMKILSDAQGKRSRLFHISKPVLAFMFKLLRRENVNQLFNNSFIIDSTIINNDFTWSPPLSQQEGINKYFINKKNRT